MTWMEGVIKLFLDICKEVGVPDADKINITLILFPYILAAIGKFHLPAHILACRFLFSMHWLLGVGRTDGEATERVWAIENGAALRSREMGPGHRHDFMNFFRGDNNIQRLHNIGAPAFEIRR